MEKFWNVAGQIAILVTAIIVANLILQATAKPCDCNKPVTVEEMNADGTSAPGTSSATK